MLIKLIARIKKFFSRKTITYIALSKERPITELVYLAHANAKEKGWYEEERGLLELLMLIVTELAEVAEDFRNKHNYTEIYYEGFKRKPCGIPIEVADAVVRIFDLCGYYGIDLEAAIIEKMNFNKSRSYRHGGKLA